VAFKLSSEIKQTGKGKKRKLLTKKSMTAKLGAGYFDEQDTEYIKHLNHIYELGKTKVNVAVSEKMVG